MKRLCLGLALVALAIPGCGKDGGPVGPGEGVDPPWILDPDPNGVLLEGGDTEAARGSLLNLAPSPVDAADVVDGLLTTRLTAAVAPAATVAAVNAALESQGARIVSMSSVSPFVTLRIPPVSDASAARAVADALVASGAFVYAAPAHAVEAAGSTGNTPAARASVLPSHLEQMRLPAAWNASELALANNDEITVIIPDQYAQTIPHADIDAQTFVGYGAPNSLPGPEIYPGNNGFVVSGVVGANADDVGATGVNPEPADLLDIESMALGGLTWFDIFNSLSWRLATAGNRFVLNTGIGYLDPDFVAFPPVERAMHVLAWRVASAIHYQKFVHVVAAPLAQENFAGGGGTPDESVLQSPFLAGAHFDDVREMVDLNQVGTADSLALETAWQDMIDSFPLATAIANNVLVVGAGGFVAGPLAYVVPDYVEAAGTGILGPCVSQDPASSPGFLCDGEVAVYSGTGVAAAQVSGLAAYLMNLSSAFPSEIRGTLVHGYQSSGSGVVDAYHAVLGLDTSVSGDVRRAVLDVAGFESSESDGDFDDYDLQVLSPAVAEGPSGDEPESDGSRGGGGGGEPPSLRYDLNGDGTIGGLGTYRFDLNADRSYGIVTQSIEGNSVSFDENAVTDFEVLCYYGYSSLYNGDPDARQQLLAPRHGGAFLEFLNVPEVIVPGVPTPITVRAGVDQDGTITYLEGIELDIFASDGDVDVSDPITGPGGIVSANVTLDPDENEVTVGVEADIGDEFAEAETSIIRPDEIEIQERTIHLYAEVAFGYRPGPPFFWVFDNYDFIDEGPQFYDPVDLSLEKNGGATVQGATASGTITAAQQSTVDLFNVDNFAGCSFDATIEGNMSFTNPSPQFEHYQAQSSAASETNVEFVVWGTAAQFNMHGSVSAKYYDVELYGPEGTVFLCDSSDDPCFTISTGGPLPPGEYTLSIDIADDAYFSENCDGEYCDPTGSETQNSSLSLNFEISH